MASNQPIYFIWVDTRSKTIALNIAIMELISILVHIHSDLYLSIYKSCTLSTNVHPSEEEIIYIIIYDELWWQKFNVQNELWICNALSIPIVAIVHITNDRTLKMVHQQQWKLWVSFTRYCWDSIWFIFNLFFIVFDFLSMLFPM